MNMISIDLSPSKRCCLLVFKTDASISSCKNVPSNACLKAIVISSLVEEYKLFSNAFLFGVHTENGSLSKCMFSNLYVFVSVLEKLPLHSRVVRTPSKNGQVLLMFFSCHMKTERYEWGLRSMENCCRQETRIDSLSLSLSFS